MTTSGEPESTSGKAGAGADAAAAYAEVAQLLSQVILAYTASGLRYWERMVDVWGRAFPPIVRTLAETAGQRDQGLDAYVALAEQLRGHLREVAEVPYEESRRVLADLDKIIAGFQSRVRPEGPGSPDAEEPWRRWEVKP